MLAGYRALVPRPQHIDVSDAEQIRDELLAVVRLVTAAVRQVHHSQELLDTVLTALGHIGLGPALRLGG